MIKKKGYPEPKELVLCTVKEVFSHSAFLTLDEYERKEGMLHISQIAYGRIRNIRDHVKPGKKMICKVTRTNPSKGHIDLSLKIVSQIDSKKKINEYRRERRIDSFLHVLAKKQGMKEADVKDLESRIIQDFDSLSEFATSVRETGDETFKGLKVGKKWVEEFKKFVEQDLDKKKEVEIKANMKVFSKQGDGVERIKSFFSELKKLNKEVSFEYLGAPNYMLRLVSLDYKKSEKQLAKLTEQAEKMAREEKIELEITRK